MIFHDVTLQAGGRISARRHDTDTLAAPAVAIFSDLIRGDVPGGFHAAIPDPRFAHIELFWTCEAGSRTAALATFYARGEVMTSSVLLSGLDPAESEAAQAFQRLIVKVFEGTAVEPGFDVLSIADRPLLATLPLPNPRANRRDLGLIADMETCLAAAYFLVTKRGA